MLNDKIKKKINMKNDLNKRPMLTRVNLSNSWPRSW
jgi:hypothetical protein